MRSSLFLSFLTAAAAAADQKRFAPVSSQSSKRGLMTCEQTYGSGSAQCGDSNSTMCYKPSLGQTCCELDNGYCDKGLYCAPVAGYCCLEDEDLATCAQNAGFALPESLLNASGSTVTVLTTATVVAVGWNSTARTTSTGHIAVATLTDPAIGSATWGVGRNSTIGKNVTIDKNATWTPPVVQVSLATKGQWTLVWMTLGIAGVGLFMSLC